MKCGNDISTELKSFFEKAVSYNTIVQKTHDIQWIIIFVDNNKKEILGISQAGQWVFKDERRFYVLKELKMFLCCVKLLEIPYIDIKTKVEENLKEFVNKEEICVSSIFPFFQIVEFAFCNMLNDYWIDLAWRWYEKLNLFERYKLVATLETISETMKISQRIRQKAKMEVTKLINKFIEN